MQRMTVPEAVSLGLNNGFPFYAYRLPGEVEFYFGAQPEGRVAERPGIKPGEGFVAVPFRESAEVPALFIRGDIRFQGSVADQQVIERLRQTFVDCRKNRIPEESVSRETYYRQVMAMIQAIGEGEARKLVLARGYTVAIAGFRLLADWFQGLAQAYPDAFVFVFSVPGVVTWIGATPEIFLKQTAEGCRTMALAGTRPLGSPGEWGKKEQEEQAIVTEYINSLLQPPTCWKIEGPFTKGAGWVEHLCTLFTSGQRLEWTEVERLRRLLHPTPAVGGFPARKAVQMVNQIEGNHRRYYAGYAGPVHANGDFHWYVNLRSMEVFPDAVRLYVGGGITALSDPEKEWEETEWKARTLLEVIRNMKNMYNVGK